MLLENDRRRRCACGRVRWFALWVVLLCLLVFPERASAQDRPTSTPDAEGIIYVEVQPQDSLWSIAARAGLTIPELLALNELDESAVLQPGDRLITGRVEPPATATSDVPTPTLPPPSATPTSEKQRTAVCIIAYEDLNKNGQFDAAEPARERVAFTVYNEREVVANYVTDGVSEPYCLEDLRPGVYHVTRSIGKDETLTTEGDWALTLAAGSVMNLAFGSYQNEGAREPTANADDQLRTRLALTPEATPTPAVEEEGDAPRTSTLIIGLAVAAFVLLASVAVLTFLFVQRRRME